MTPPHHPNLSCYNASRDCCDNLTDLFSPVSPATIFHIAAKLIFLHIKHITSCNTRGGFWAQNKRQSLTGPKRCHVICHTPSRCVLCICISCLVPLTHSTLATRGHSPLKMARVHTSHSLCPCYSTCLLMSTWLDAGVHMAWSLSPSRCHSNATASKSLSWPLRYLLCPLTSLIFLLRFITTHHIFV